VLNAAVITALDIEVGSAATIAQPHGSCRLSLLAKRAQPQLAGYRDVWRSSNFETLTPVVKTSTSVLGELGTWK